MNKMPDTRPSPIAGRWYPAEPARLAQVVDQYINAARLPDIEGEVIAVVTPHAGYPYSGPVAGFSFAAVRGLHPELVVIISPMHHPYYQPLLTSAHEVYATPFGLVPIDRQAVRLLDEELKNELGFGLTAVRNDPEHSLEIELPFLQRAMGDNFPLLPVMVRDQSLPTVRSLGLALAHAVEGRQALLVASTDLSHYYPQKTANILDRELLHRVVDFDPIGVLNAEDEGTGYACGKGALAAVLWAAKEMGGDRVQVLNYATSGDVTGDFNQVVGYGAAVVTRPI